VLRIILITEIKCRLNESNASMAAIVDVDNKKMAPAIAMMGN
jgi:hypothetical protein